MPSIPNRIHLFEFTDQSWLKGSAREAFMDCIDVIHHIARPYKGLAAKIKECADHAKSDSILDTCSGGGEQLRFILDDAHSQVVEIPKIIASDLFPQTEQYRGIIDTHGEHMFDYITSSVDLLDKTTHEDYRFMSLFTALHHFRPVEVRDIFKSAIETKDAVFVAEFTERTFINAIGPIIFAPMFLIAPLFSRRPTFLKIIFTTIVPVIPLMVVFDGLVSTFRSYTVEEIEELFLEAEFGQIGETRRDRRESAFILKSGKYRNSPFGHTTYFYAYRKK